MPYTLDLDQILKNKMGARAKWVPQFLVNALKRLIHQDWLNVFIEREGEITGVQWVKDCLDYINVKVEVVGAENLPAVDAAPCTFVSNHPLGGADGVALGAILGERYDGRIKLFVNDLLMNLHGLAPLCVPVNKTGGQSRRLPELIKAAFDSENHVVTFPAGLCSRKIDGEIQDLPWKKTFITKSVETHRDVVPLFFEGKNSPRFYRIATWCKRLGMKFNLAMLYLPDELVKAGGKTFRVHVGKPIPWQTFTADKTVQEWTEYVRQQSYSLQNR